MNKKIIIGVLAALLLIACGVAWWRATAVPSYPVLMAAGERVSSWDFTGAYTGNAELEAKARSEIERFTQMIGKGEFTDYILYVSIANEYNLLGDGKNELKYLRYALAIDSQSTGLAWNNAGALFVRLGALKTARMAYERAVAAQPTAQYRTALIDFLKEHYPEDLAAIRAAEEATGGAELPQ